ncbi:hypothetical protein D3C77_468550 [compost metagenome]
MPGGLDFLQITVARVDFKLRALDGLGQYQGALFMGRGLFIEVRLLEGLFALTLSFCEEEVVVQKDKLFLHLSYGFFCSLKVKTVRPRDFHQWRDVHDALVGVVVSRPVFNALALCLNSGGRFTFENPIGHYLL